VCRESEKEEPRKNSGKFPSFKQRFLSHISAGTRPGRKTGAQPVPWDAASLSKTLAEIMKGSAPDIRTVRNWVNNNDIPQERFVVPILTILFGDDPALAEQRTELHDLWRLSQQAKRPPGQAAQAALSNNPPDPDLVAPAAEQWQVTDVENIGLGLAALYLHLPASNDPNSFLLHVSLSLAQFPDEIEGISLRLGLKAAQIVPGWTHCQPVELMDQDHVTEAGGVFTVTGPRDEASGHLVGRPLSNTTLARIAPTGADLPEVTLALRSRKRDLDVVADDPDHDISINRAAILKLFLQECQVSDTDRMVTWSRARLQRKPDR
jgi:hypothetical protein